MNAAGVAIAARAHSRFVSTELTAAVLAVLVPILLREIRVWDDGRRRRRGELQTRIGDYKTVQRYGKDEEANGHGAAPKQDPNEPPAPF